MLGSGGVIFDAFWQATCEPPFDTLTATCAECYRLSIEVSRSPEHRVYRMQRSPDGMNGFVAHFVSSAGPEPVTAETHEIVLEEDLWGAFSALLAVARFWELPSEKKVCGLDGSTYTLEAWKSGRSHKVVRWSPNPIITGGELFAVLTDYLERLGELAILECDAELRMRYVPDYVPTRHPPRGKLA